MQETQAKKENPVLSIHAEREERILKFWDENTIFEKSLKKESPRGTYTFYDGPPFATGTPHYGHILAGTIKDVIPRYKTMLGFNVPRRWGWDCHGLPVENLIEKELSLKSKKDIIDFGIGKFNEQARNSVMRYADEWRRIVPRFGRFVDMDHDYRTMDSAYTESVWWIFKTLYDKNLIYEGFKSMSLCPHCETTLSNFEVAQGYKDITDISVYAKFKIKDSSSEPVYFLAWTTTPWTLPGNTALAVNPEIDYVKIKISGAEEQKNGLYILAKTRLSVLKDLKYEVLENFKGKDLVGKSYVPIFDYYANDAKLRNATNGWKVYGAEFVTTEDGTGIVHIAPAFGSEDYELSLKENIPFVQHVAMDGTFKNEVLAFAGQKVKAKDTEQDKNAHQLADIEVIKWLSHHGFLFEKEKLIHSYPHCWRCDTPLLNYATSSWFVKVTDIKDKLVKENEKIEWVPPEIGIGRFGNWLEGARDWAISRTRFWGAPIPVWKETDASGKVLKHHVLGSVGELRKFSKPKNTYYLIRHGEAENNTSGLLSSKADAPHHLTEKGKEQVKDAALAVKSHNFDLVFCSPFVRTRETMEILKAESGWKDSQIFFETKLGELNAGSWNGRPVKDLIAEFPLEVRFDRAPQDGETYTDIKKRMGNFIYDLEQKYEGKKILIVTHETPGVLLIAVSHGWNRAEIVRNRGESEYIKNAELKEVDFVPLPHNAEYELDLHRPMIDTISLQTENGNKLTRVPDVFDCWFESGAMPYGSNQYPATKSDFEPKSSLFHKAKGYPADFIAEGLDQTRGWFYSMLVLGVALFDKTPYKKVIVNGMILAEDGQKMSKSKKNFPDPMGLVNKYGADSVRFYILSSPAVHGEDLRFSERGVDEVTKKIVNRLLNVLSFYKMFDADFQFQEEKVNTSPNPIDQWIISRLNQTILEVTRSLEAGELDKATRPFWEFGDDISTWYLRRSRDRFKGDDQSDKDFALNTTAYILNQTAKILAPFVPFLAEEIYRTIKIGTMESVHLESWPESAPVDHSLLNNMSIVRELSSNALEARTVAKINVRQPLGKLKIKENKLLSSKFAEQDFLNLVKDEVNVKEIIFDTKIKNSLFLDTTITEELKAEGEVRELLRQIQDLRKEKGLAVGQNAILTIPEKFKDLIEKNKAEICKATSLSEIKFGSEFLIEKI